MSFATRIVRGPGRARRRACERRAAAAGWQVPAEPTMPRLNSRDRCPALTLHQRIPIGVDERAVWHE